MGRQLTPRGACAALLLFLLFVLLSQLLNACKFLFALSFFLSIWGDSIRTPGTHKRLLIVRVLLLVLLSELLSIRSLLVNFLKCSEVATGIFLDLKLSLTALLSTFVLLNVTDCFVMLNFFVELVFSLLLFVLLHVAVLLFSQHLRYQLICASLSFFRSKIFFLRRLLIAPTFVYACELRKARGSFG